MRQAVRPWAAMFLGLLLAFQTAFAGQAGAPLGLRILVVSGDDAENRAGRSAGEPFAVVVVDRDNVLIPNAQVEFAAPEAGPGGEFEDGSKTFRTTTDEAGRAVAGSYLPNEATGVYAVRVTAEFNGESATAVIPQTNLSSSGSGGRVIAILSLVGIAVGTAFALGRSGSGDSPSSPDPSANPGGGSPPTIGFGDSSVNQPQ